MIRFFNKLARLQKRQKAYKKLTKRKRIYRKVEKSLVKRNRAEKRFKFYGIVSITICLAFLLILLFSIFSKGYSAFFQTKILLNVEFNQELVADELYNKILLKALKDKIPEINSEQKERLANKIFSQSAGYLLQNMLNVDKDLIGKTKEIWITTSSDVDMFIKSSGLDIDNVNTRLDQDQIYWLKSLNQYKLIKLKFNKDFFVNGDSRDPESAGVLGAVVGSIFVIFICIIVAFPIGVSTAIYLEEFAPKSRLSEIIEVNINNLAAVPSIVFGLLGLTLYIQTLGVPRSASLAGGLTMALIALPIIVISTRMSIRAIPPSIKDAAMALGASKWQVTIHHVLPLAMPGIMTGSILSIARVMGETAPLIMIGMIAFVVDVPHNIISAATVMPVQIYLWSDSVEPGFVEKASAVIIVLLFFLCLINLLAAYVRKKFEIKW